MTKSDGIFKWYWGHGKEPEVMWGGEDTREAILQVARLESDGPFLIQYSDKSVPSAACFYADNVLDQYEEHNEECWSEDGSEIDATPEQKRELEAKLADCLDRWMRKHGVQGRTWGFGVIRHQEFFNEEEQAAA